MGKTVLGFLVVSTIILATIVGIAPILGVFGAFFRLGLIVAAMAIGGTIVITILYSLGAIISWFFGLIGSGISAISNKIIEPFEH